MPQQHPALLRRVTEQDASLVRSFRLLMVIGAVAFPAYGVLDRVHGLEYYDPFILRLVASGMFLGTCVLTYASAWVRQHIRSFAAVLVLYATAYTSWLAVANKLDGMWALGLITTIVVSCIVSALYTPERHLIARSLIALTSVVAVFILPVPNLVIPREMFMGYVLVVAGTAYAAGVFRIRALEELKASEVERVEQDELLRTIIDTIPDHLYVKDRRGKAILRNLASAEALGFDSPEQSIGLADTESMPSDASRGSLADDLHVVETGKPFYDRLERTPNGDGWLSTTKVPLRDQAGTIIGLVGISRDITKARQSEEALRQAKEAAEAREREVEAQQRLLRTIIDAIPDPVFAKDREGRCITRNLADARLIGYEAVEPTLGLTVFDTLPEHIAMRLWAADVRVMESGEAQIGREERITFGDQEKWLLSSKIPLLGEGGQVAGMVGILRDITERKANEVELLEAKDAAEHATRAKSDFLATMSHEIRTPMNGVIGMTSLLLDSPLNHEQRDFVETIRASGDALLTLINDILDFSKIEAGHLELETHPFEVRSVIEEALDLIAPKAAQKGIELAYMIEDGTPRTVASDATRLRQVLVNLVSNAVKFTEKGSVFVRVSSEPQEPEAGSACVLEIAVEDTGIGIATEKLDQVFESFKQADASTTRKHGGTGLGLAISQRLVGLMGGEMSVTSTEGVGSTFSFSVHVEVAPSTKRVFLHPNPPELTGRRVLVVDDNEVNRTILLRFAERWGMYVTLASSGLEALTIASEQTFDLVLLDMQMPEMDGLAVAAALSRMEQPPIVVMLTSLHRDGPARAAADHGVDAVLYKPIKPARLYDTLLNVFGQASTEALVTFEIDSKLAETPSGEINGTLRILVAEDNVVNQKVALRILKRLGYRADVAANGLEVLQSLRRQPYDVILMDVQMPEMDGLEATRKIREQMAPESQPYIIALTANAMQGDRERCLDAGTDAYLAKPVDVRALDEALRRYTDTPQMAAIAGHAAASEDDVQSAWSSLAAQIGENDPEFVREITGSYLESTEELLSRARTGLASGDLDEAARVAHTLRSSSALLGFDEIIRLCTELEEHALEGGFDETSAGLHEVEREFERVRPVVLTLLHGVESSDQETDRSTDAPRFPNWITKSQ